MANQPGKTVIYVDVDDEITTIIDKMRSADQRIVALVLPKRTAVLQSIVNMKLLDRSAKEAKKHLVLITAEQGLLPLAGAVGVYIAKTLQSKPEVPKLPFAADPSAKDGEEAVSMPDDSASEDAGLDPSRPVGEYAADAKRTATDVADDDLPIELDNSDPIPGANVKLTGKAKKNKKLAVPNFGSFRTRLLLGGLALLVLIAGGYSAAVVMPRANIHIKTDSNALDTNLDITLNTGVDKVNTAANVLPAKSVQVQKTTSQQAVATGQKDKGEKASGNIKIINCTGGDWLSIPAGTGVSVDGLTFITQEVATMPVGSKNCKQDIAGVTSDIVKVVAMAAGDKYNIAASTFTMAGYVDTTKVTSSEAMSGGTSNIVKVVSQADIDGAKQKMSNQGSAEAKIELKKQLQSQTMYAIETTFAAGGPEITASASVGDEVSDVTVTQKTTYTMLGVQESYLKQIIATDVNKRIDDGKQFILDYGLDKAEFKIQNQQSGTALITLETTAVTGSNLDTAAIKRQVAGKKAGQAKDSIESYPGVVSVDVQYSPFWVSSIPKNVNKITITVEKPTVSHATQKQ